MKLQVLAAAAATLPDRLPRVRDPIAGRRIAKGAHLLLANLANGRRAFDVALAEGLYALSLGDRCLQVKYASTNDYAREVLGIPASTAEKLTRFGKRLRGLPVIREAVRTGELSLRKAEMLAAVARPGDEMRLVMMAKGETVRSLKARLAAPDDSADEQWLNFSAGVAPEQLPVVHKGLRVARQFLRPGSSKMERVEIMGQEFLGSHAPPEDDKADDVYFAADETQALEAELSGKTAAGPISEKGEPMRAPELQPTTDPWYIDGWLKSQARKRELWDETFGARRPDVLTRVAPGARWGSEASPTTATRCSACPSAPSPSASRSSGTSSACRRYARRCGRAESATNRRASWRAMRTSTRCRL